MTSRFPRLDADLMSDRLAPPSGQLRLLIDTDAANEIDDQFGLAWALRSPKKLRIEALTAEPYSFAHLLPELRAAEAAMVAGKEYAERLVPGLGSRRYSRSKFSSESPRPRRLSKSLT